LGKHRKVHLFDIDVPGKITFKESDTLTGGGSVTVVDCPFAGGFKLGVGICYDIRFPEVCVWVLRVGGKKTHERGGRSTGPLLGLTPPRTQTPPTPPTSCP